MSHPSAIAPLIEIHGLCSSTLVGGPLAPSHLALDLPRQLKRIWFDLRGTFHRIFKKVGLWMLRESKGTCVKVRHNTLRGLKKLTAVSFSAAMLISLCFRNTSSRSDRLWLPPANGAKLCEDDSAARLLIYSSSHLNRSSSFAFLLPRALKRFRKHHLCNCETCCSAPLCWYFHF